MRDKVCQLFYGWGGGGGLGYCVILCVGERKKHCSGLVTWHQGPEETREKYLIPICQVESLKHYISLKLTLILIYFSFSTQQSAGHVTRPNQND